MLQQVGAAAAGADHAELDLIVGGLYCLDTGKTVDSRDSSGGKAGCARHFDDISTRQIVVGWACRGVLL